MNIVRGTPPNYQAIVAAFPAAARAGVVFTYGDTVYVNGTPELPTQLKAHEAVHVQQQARIGGPDPWWCRYLSQPIWRLEQELAAHRAEYRTLRHLVSREQAAKGLHFIAERLASPLYGGIISAREARKAILS